MGEERFDEFTEQVSQHHAWRDEDLPYREFLRTYPEEKPEAFRNVSQYMLDIIREQGSEDCIEQGQERTRYNIFNHDFGNYHGDNVRLRGNEAFQEDLVHLLEGAAHGRGPQDRLIVIKGPPATGKSLVREILTDAIEHYSGAVDGGEVYTIKWDMEKVMEELDNRPSPYQMPLPPRMEGGEPEETDNPFVEGKCPKNDAPLSIIPDEMRSEILAQANENFDGDYELGHEGDPCSFCQTSLDILLERYDNDFGALLEDDAVRVQRIKLSEATGNGYGFLDPNNSKREEALYGEKVRSMGGQHFTYIPDGELMRCNRGLLFFEDIGQVVEELQGSILDYIEEHKAKPAAEPREYVDSFKIALSNLEIEEKLEELEEDEHNELQGLGDRIRVLSLGYLTEYTKEVDLLKDMLGTEREDKTFEEMSSREGDFFGTRVMEPLYLTNNGQEIEIMPHALEAAGLIGVMTRIEPKGYERGGDVTEGVTIDPEGDAEEFRTDKLETALLYAHGEIDGVEYNWDEFKDSINPEEGLDPRALDFRFLIDNVNAAISNTENQVATPDDILKNIIKHSEPEPGVGRVSESYRGYVEKYIMDTWNEEAKTAFTYVPGITDNLDEYIEQVLLWSDEDAQQQDEFTGEWVDEDEDLLNDIEDRLGIPEDDREDFRQDRIIGAIAGVKEETGKSTDEVSWEDIKALENAISPNTWDDVLEDRNLDRDEFFRNLKNPMSEDAVERRETLEDNLQDLYGYSERSAPIVIEKIADWNLDKGNYQSTI